METEVKFYLNDLAGLERRARELGAALVQPRVFELNLRFDTPDHSLKQTARVLRLRQDTAARLTYKGPGNDEDRVKSREEIEFTVSDFDAARSVLEAIGYRVVLVYEKYRTVYDLGEVHLMLDEMPYGSFAEIEGPDSESIRRAALRLNLDWETRSCASYTGLFEQVRRALDLQPGNLTFARFSGLQVTAGDLGIEPSDRSALAG